MSTGAPDRGPEAVRRRLIDAAKELMEDRSPRKISGRELAKRADVNYGLIHHYFGSKDAVFAAAFNEDSVKVVADFLEGGVAEPVPIRTSEWAHRFRTLAHLALDDEVEEFVTAFPVTQAFAKLRAESTGREPTDPDVLAEVAAVTVLQLGWGIFEEYVMIALAPFEPDRDELRERVAALSTLIRTPTDDDPAS